MAKKGGGTTSTMAMDPATVDYMRRFREMSAGNASRYGAQAGGVYGDLAARLRGVTSGLGGIEQYMNPLESGVIDAVRGDFNTQRGTVDRAAADMATRSGAYGGDREAILRANAMRDVNRNEMSTISGLRMGGYENAIRALMQDRNLMAQLGLAGAGGLGALAQMGAGGMQAGLTPTSTTNRQQMDDPNWWQQILGLGSTLGGMGAFGPLAGLFSSGQVSGPMAQGR